MTINSRYFSAAIVVVGVLLGATVLAFEEDWNAQWKLRPSLSIDKVHFTIRRSDGFGSSTHSQDVPLERFRGFSLAMLATGGPAKFEYVHDAGRLLCEGRFALGGGSGSFTFAPNPEFVAALRELGYDAPDENRLFQMMMVDISREFARGVRDAGLRTSTSGLVQLRIHGVSLAYIQEAQQAGYDRLSAEDYTQLRIHGVTTKFLRDLRSAGYDLRAAEITQLAIHGVDSAFMRDLKSYGLQPRAADLTQLKIHGVTPEYLRDLKEAGYGSLGVDEINQLRIHGVETGFVRAARTLGYDFTPKELAELRIHGVDARYLQKLRDVGMRNLTASQISQLRIHGVE